MTNKMFNYPSGIYQIRNLLNGKIYIGQSCRLVDRKYNHFRLLRLNKEHTPHLQNAYNKYGKDAFVFEILLYCDVDDLDFYEQLFVDSLHPEYNVRSEVTSNRGHKMSEETKLKISVSQIGKRLTDAHRKLLSEVHKGFQHSESTKKKMSERMMGHKINLGRIQTPEEKIKRATSVKKYWKTHKKVNSPEARKKMSIARLLYLEKHHGV